MADWIRNETAARTKGQQEHQAQAARRAVMRLPELDAEIQINGAVSMSLSDRLVVYGMTGTGKTTFIKQLFPRMRAWYGGTVPVNIIDSKGYYEYNDVATRTHIGPTAPEAARAGEVLVWVIPGEVSLEALDSFLSAILTRGAPCLVIADELVNFGAGSADTYVQSLTNILKQGRFAKIMLISMTQEVAKMPRNLAGQTTHVVSFYLRNEYDRREANRLLGLPSEQGRAQPPQPHGFFYSRVDRPSPVLSYTGWQEFFRF